ncbi:MAG: class I SAM-dependent methyltransferase [Verrucomicrobia bacterium]|nr:class I SAM-dependent methyltransferase [Verrucomicrobiota bacterium]MDA1066163.1 class I SAM-dependent methyltransferase [Verrucomicrobiota bacterium]
MSNLFQLFSRKIKDSIGLKRKRQIRHLLYRFKYGSDLQKLAVAYGTDKEAVHFYSKRYQHHFEPVRLKKLNVLEIGIGGYAKPKDGGESLRMWKTYFPNSNIYGIDIHDKSFHEEDRIKTFKGSQVDREFLSNVVKDIGDIDVIIDDGSHYSPDVIATFNFLFPFLAPNGIYAIEDLQTSYWGKNLNHDWGGSSDKNAPHTSMNFLKSLTDGLNYEEFTEDNYEPTYLDKNIVSIHFYHNLVFLQKGDNNEGSNRHLLKSF